MGCAHALVNAIVFDKGDFPESFPVTVYANITEIVSKVMSNVLNGTSTVLNFIWNATGSLRE